MTLLKIHLESVLMLNGMPKCSYRLLTHKAVISHSVTDSYSLTHIGVNLEHVVVCTPVLVWTSVVC